MDGYVDERKVNKFDEILKRARRRRYQPRSDIGLYLIVHGQLPPKNGLDLIVERYAPMVRNLRKGDRRKN